MTTTRSEPATRCTECDGSGFIPTGHVLPTTKPTLEMCKCTPKPTYAEVIQATEGQPMEPRASVVTDKHLLTAVEYLAKPYVSPVPQDFGDSLVVTRLQMPPRLAQLRSSIVGGIGKTGASKNEHRSPINEKAFDLYNEIEKAIDEWCRTIGLHTAHTTPEGALNAWYVAWLAAKPAAHNELAKLREWRSSIENLFDPYVSISLRIETTDTHGRKITAFPPCPECFDTHAPNPATRELSGALVLEYREIGKKTIEEARAHCRSCKAEWQGITAIRALRYDLELQQQEGNNS